jgi:ABC-type antimicrobial peptide transport system permease subunit
LLFAFVMGLLGGWFPARQAMKMRVVDALRRI